MSEKNEAIKAMYDKYIDALASSPFKIQEVEKLLERWQLFCDQQGSNINEFCRWNGNVAGFFHPLFTTNGSGPKEVKQAESLSWEHKYEVLHVLFKAGVDPMGMLGSGQRSNSTLMMDVVASVPGEQVGRWIDLLIEFGADVDQQYEGSFALKWAISAAKLEAAHHLVLRGAGVKKLDQRKALEPLLMILEGLSSYQGDLPGWPRLRENLMGRQRAWAEREELLRSSEPGQTKLIQQIPQEGKKDDGGPRKTKPLSKPKAL